MATSITAITGGTPNVKVSAQPKQFQQLFDVIYAEVALTDATIAAQNSAQVDVTVPGAELGDFVLVSYPAALAGVLIEAQVKSANTVSVFTFNTEATDAVTAMSGGLTAKILVLKTAKLFGA